MGPENPAAQLFSWCIINFISEPATQIHSLTDTCVSARTHTSITTHNQQHTTQQQHTHTHTTPPHTPTPPHTHTHTHTHTHAHTHPHTHCKIKLIHLSITIFC